VRAALAHSPVLQAAESEEHAATARAAQARAGGRPTLTADARTAHYWGLSDRQLGPQIVIPGIADRYNAGLQAMQPLYTGGRVARQRAATTLARAAAEQTRRGTEADVTLAALAAYWGWSQAFHAVASFRAAVTRVAQHNTDMQQGFKAGLATESDALATTVQMENTRLQLAEAERRVELARARLAYLTGHELPPQAAPLATTGAAETSVPAENTLLEQARTNRAEALARRLEVRVAGEQVEAARADRRPQFAAVARYEQVRPNMLFIPPEDQWNYDAFVGLTASWNIWDSGLTRAKVAEATARREQARQRQRQTDDQIALDIRAARVDWANAGERLAVAQRAAASARRNLKVADDLWKNGLTRHVDLLDAHAQLTDAEVRISVTRAEVELARAALDHATGKLGTGK
jgi:outer membrane protein TolC